MARRPYYRVKYDEANGFEYPYYDIKFDKPDYIPPTPSITPTPSPTSIPCPDYVCLDFSEPSLQDYNGAYYQWTTVYKGATPKINCDGYYYGYKGTTLNGKSGLIYYDGSDWIATLFAPSTTINCNDDITATNPNYISERVLTSAVSQCEYTYYRPDFSSFSGGSEECIVPTPSVTPTISLTPSPTPCVLPNTICIDFNGTVNSGYTEYNGRYTLYKENALFEYVSNPATNQYTYDVNCTGSSLYSLYTGYTDNGPIGGILFDNVSPDNHYHPFVLISGTPQCGNQVTVKWELTYDTPPQCDAVYYGDPNNIGWNRNCSPT